MKKTVVYIIIMILATTQISAQSGKQKGVTFTIRKGFDKEATVNIEEDAQLDVVIPEKVKIRGKECTVTDIRATSNGAPIRSITIPKTVSSISLSNCVNLETVILEEGMKEIPIGAFRRCVNLESIVIPNTVKDIGGGAFEGCEKLVKVTLPDQYWSVPYKDLFGAPFKGCYNLAEITGHMVKYPQYLLESSFRYMIEDKCPFAKKRLQIKKTFSYYAEEQIVPRIKKWQQKKEYETSAQWKIRVTEETQKKKISEVTEQVKKEYIDLYSPRNIRGTIGTYDADYGIFPITMYGVKNVLYAQVPLSEAKAFKDNWNKVTIQPQYGIVDDMLGIITCTFEINGHIYHSTNYESNVIENDFTINLPPIDMTINNDVTTPITQQAIMDTNVDQQIPSNSTDNKKTFAVIIGNETYQRVTNVEYARNDATVFGEYCQKTLGIPTKNIRSYNDATFGTMLAALKDIKSIANAYNGDLNVIFYYAGHGIPDGTGKAYLLPVDADGTQVEICLATSRLYKELSELNANSVIIFMDACFSGAKRGEGMITAARGVALKTKSDIPQGNCIVFSASNGEETAFPYKEKGHGMFTYFLLKKLQETKGDVTLGELGEYIHTNVQKLSVVVNHKQQTPTVIPSANVVNWKAIKLR